MFKPKAEVRLEATQACHVASHSQGSRTLDGCNFAVKVKVGDVQWFGLKLDLSIRHTQVTQCGFERDAIDVGKVGLRLQLEVFETVQCFVCCRLELHFALR